MDKITRREFIEHSVTFAISLSVSPILSCSDKNENKEVSQCLTTDDILGPFYRVNAPFRSDLTIPNQQGQVIFLRGKTIADDCATPIGGAIVDIWHAGYDGVYDNTSSDYLYRGRFLTNKDGSYEFKTIIPGRYLNGNTYRPSHFHLRVTAPGYEELISQLYFDGDPFIDSDPWASSPAATLRILTPQDLGNGTKEVYFDIGLKAL